MIFHESTWHLVVPSDILAILRESFHVIYHIHFWKKGPGRSKRNLIFIFKPFHTIIRVRNIDFQDVQIHMTFSGPCTCKKCGQNLKDSSCPNKSILLLNEDMYGEHDLANCDCSYLSFIDSSGMFCFAHLVKT